MQILGGLKLIKISVLFLKKNNTMSECIFRGIEGACISEGS
jgi:hypothetical protein